MLINFLADSIAPWGTYFRTHNLARSLTALGSQVRIFAVDDDPGSQERVETREGVEYHITPSRRGQRFFTSQHHPLLAIARASSDYPRADVVHMFQPFLTTYAPWRRKLAKQGSLHWYDWDDLWTDGGLLGEGRGRNLRERWVYYWANRIERNAPRAATGVTVVSNWLAKEAKRFGARKTAVIYNGLWPREPTPRTTARTRFALAPSSIYLGFMGRTLSATEFFWCLDGLRSAMPRYDVRLAICGPLDHFRSMIPQDLRKNIDYLGVLSAADCLHFASALDFGLLPLEENLFNNSRFPMKLCEYLSVQTRVIASNVGETACFRGLQGVINAGTGREAWASTVQIATEKLTQRLLPPVEPNEIQRALSWESIGEKALAAYES